MTVNFRTLKRRALLLVGDDYAEDGGVLSGSSNSADLLKAAADAALDAVLPWCWKNETLALASGSYSYNTPSNLYRIEGVLDQNSGVFLPPTTLDPGRYFGYGKQEDNSWVNYPSGSITFSTELTDDGVVLYYAAFWNKPSDDNDLLEVPDYLLAPLSLYMASHLCLPKAFSAANIRQYGTRVDSGTPEDNPLMTMSNNFLKRFEIEMNRLPMMSKGIR